MDKAYATIRLAAAYVVGVLLTWVAETLGVGIDEETSTAMRDAVTMLLSVGYYLVIRILATRLPWIEWLLVVPKSPVYVAPDKLEVAKRTTNQFN